MANDRISLICQECGIRITLMKYYPARAYAPNLDHATFGARVEKFMAEHLESCHSQWGLDSLGDDPGFLCVTEDGEFAFDEARAAEREIA